MTGPVARMFGAVVCLFAGHRRGKRLPYVDGGHILPGMIRTACPRCGGNRKTRKAREAK